MYGCSHSEKRSQFHLRIKMLKKDTQAFDNSRTFYKYPVQSRGPKCFHDVADIARVTLANVTNREAANHHIIFKL